MTVELASPETFSHERGWQTFRAAVCGFDLGGFTRWVEQLMERDGAAALEVVMDQLDDLFAAVGDALEPCGAAVHGLLGDGLLAVRPGAAAEPLLAEMTATLEGVLATSWSHGPARAGAASGFVTQARLGGWNERWIDLLTGPAVADYHLRAAQAPRRPPDPAAVPPQPRRRTKLLDAEIGERAMLLACLRSRPALEDLQARARLGQGEADARGGLLETITHDDGGVMLRFSFAGDAAGTRAAADLARAIRARTQALGLRPSLGLAAGPVFRASVAAGGPDAWTVHGRAVNVAARLAKGGRGLRLDGSAEQRLGPAGGGRRRSPATVGVRNAEFASVVDCLGRWGEVGRLVDIEGEAGIGKSHLLRRLAAHGWPGPAVLVSARPQHGLDAYWIWGQVAQTLAAADPDTQTVLAGLERGPARALHRLMYGGAAPADESSAETEVALTQALDRIFGALGRRRGVLLVDDLQWADAPSLVLLARIVESCPGLGLVTARRTYPGAAQGPRPAALSLRLAPLDADDLQLTLSRATGRPVEAGELYEVRRLSGGNPLFALQLVLAARETGAWVAGGIAAVVAARLSRLDPTERAILRVLAVAERALEAADVSDVAGRNGVAVGDDHLERLVTATFLAREPAGGGFQLAHQLLVDPIRDQIAPSLVPRLHDAVARRLRRGQRDGRLALGYGEIARHWRAAGATARAVAGLLRDGERSLQAGSYNATVALLDEAEAAMAGFRRDQPHRALMHANRGQAHWALGQLDRAASDARAAIAAVDLQLGEGRGGRGRLRRLWLVVRSVQGGLSPRTSSALLRASVVRAEVGMFTGDLASILGGNLTSARIAGDAAAKARGLSFVGLMAGLMRAPFIARRVYDRGQAMTTGVAAAYCHASEAVWHLAFGRWQVAAARLDAADALLGEVVDPHLREAMLTLRALSAQMRGEHAECQALFEALLASATARGNRMHEAWGLYGQAMPMVQCGRPELALSLVERAFERLADIGDRQSVLICHGLRAQAAARLGWSDEALAAAEQGVRFSRDTPPTNFGSLEGFAGPLMAVVAVLGDASATPAQTARARDLKPAALRVLGAYARVFPLGGPRLMAAKARLARLRGDHTAAKRLAATAVQAAHRLAMAGEAAGAPWPDFMWGNRA